MMLHLLRLRRLLWGLVLLASTVPALAHDPFDGNLELHVLPSTLEVRVTLGYDAARAWLRTAALPAAQVSALTRGSIDDPPQQLPTALAARLLQLSEGARRLDAVTLHAAPGIEETTLVAVYPHPQGTQLRLQATYYDAVADMRPGGVIVLDSRRRLLASLLVSPMQPALNVSLAAPAAAPPLAFFTLGLQHILTGFDHLLFLCALLLGVRRLRAQLAVITIFTLAHSVTLALAALDLVRVAPAFIEPAIALSIMLACLDNLWRRDAPADRYALALGFGLLHGFGFAAGLREAGLAAGGGIALPLLSFNLGVEIGQLGVAAVIVPTLWLARRRPPPARHGVPVLSGVLSAVSAVWLVQRLGSAAS